MSNAGQHLLSGAISGLASTITLQPLDLLKTRMQQGDGRVSTSRHTGTVVSLVRDIVRTDGVLGLWRGTAPTLLRNVPGVALYFAGMNQIRTTLATTAYFAAGSERTSSGSVLPKLNKQGNLLAGAFTRVAVGALLNPFTVLKARYESKLYQYSSMTSAIGSLTRAGPSELFRGVVATSLRDAPYAGLFVLCYEQLKHELSILASPTSSAQSGIVHGLSAATSGALATLATHPLDVVKTKMQVRTDAKYQGFNRSILTIQRERGLLGFFDGALLRLSRKPLNSAIAWATYEAVLMFMRSA
ncbi:mitochondrial carrier domain-containing protein [Fomitopsis serialis]|uniref:mitochondrial carrier domain-containing protein n=1 Tax=Fomitopsis serialis TaxID=139415 RepID=UPI0020078AA5|nr:mitochondrial carrier domain-containing protein [Neoantrodia serialis]KAH9923262.1 mitochondrial carrier domain-containing protein [Neoantrodia serialis]